MNRQFPVRIFHPLASCALVAHQDIVVVKIKLKRVITIVYHTQNYF
jgi:hypothetical protein